MGELEVLAGAQVIRVPKLAEGTWSLREGAGTAPTQPSGK